MIENTNINNLWIFNKLLSIITNPKHASQIANNVVDKLLSIITHPRYTSLITHNATDKMTCLKNALEALEELKNLIKILPPEDNWKLQNKVRKLIIIITNPEHTSQIANNMIDKMAYLNNTLTVLEELKDSIKNKVAAEDNWRQKNKIINKWQEQELNFQKKCLKILEECFNILQEQSQNNSNNHNTTFVIETCVNNSNNICQNIF